MKIEKIAKYATVTEDDGVNYRQIAESMQKKGYKMNHSSARNYLLKSMKRFASEINIEWNLGLPGSRIDEIAKSPLFQSTISEILQQGVIGIDNES